MTKTTTRASRTAEFALSLEGSGEDEGDGEGGIVGPASNVFKRTLPFVQLSFLNIESEVWKVRISCDSCISLKSRFERTKLLAAHPFSSLLTFNSTFSSFKTSAKYFLSTDSTSAAVSAWQFNFGNEKVPSITLTRSKNTAGVGELVGAKLTVVGDLVMISRFDITGTPYSSVIKPLNPLKIVPGLFANSKPNSCGVITSAGSSSIVTSASTTVLPG
mmetsp:Transcript_28109/g.39063  ORF Transcript_28109/g.39063 Transcript_28109/m.39063 type:complete len:217 (+) Transcript_28109:1095-1745(+)